MRGKTIKITLVIVICIIAVITAAVLVPKATKEEQRTAENMAQEETTAQAETTAQEETKLETEPEEVTKLTDPKTEEVTEPETQMQTAVETRADSETTEEVTVPEIKKQNGSSVVSLSFVGDIYLSPMMEQNYRQSGISGDDFTENPVDFPRVLILPWAIMNMYAVIWMRTRRWITSSIPFCVRRQGKR